MYQPHELFNPPPQNAILWRYMDFAKFISLLDKQALFFVRADKLGDPFEGSYTRVNVEVRPKIYEGQIPEHALTALADFTREARRFTTISCWRWNSNESAGMWRQYSSGVYGIAIKTTFRALADALTGEDDVFIGTVDYVDYETAFIREDNLLAPFLHKRTSFESEREVRAINIQIPLKDGASDLSKDIYDVGDYQPIDLNGLVSEIVVAPSEEKWVFELVESVTRKYGLTAPVRMSALSHEPVWK